MDTIFCKGVFTIDTFNFVPHRDVKVSFSFNNGITSFFSGAKQINRRRVHAEKSFEFKVSGLKTEMDALIAFYNKQHGMKKEFLFVYDGIEEHCFFAEPITISVIRELSKVVGYEANVKLICAFQVSPYQGRALTSDKLNITPKDKVEHKIDWNTNIVSMTFYARQETYTEPTETFTVNLVGTKANRDELIKMFNIHGAIPFTFTFDDKDYLVRFPSSIEITDNRSMTRIQGFESSFDLEVVKAPNNGTYYKDTTINTPALILKKDLSLRNWYIDGCMIEGKSYKDNLGVGLERLQDYYITDCTNAFYEAKDIEVVPALDTTKCSQFAGMFCRSSVRFVRGLDMSGAVDVRSMFEGSVVENITFPLDMPLCEEAQCMFRGASMIKSLPRVTIGLDSKPYELFRSAYSLVDIKGFIAPNLESADYLFAGTAITGLPTLDFPKLKEAILMFGGCNSLKSISFRNSGQLLDVMGMFLYCYSLESITGLNLTNVTPTGYSRISYLEPEPQKDMNVYLDLFVNPSEDYCGMFSSDPHFSSGENGDIEYPYKGLYPDGIVNSFGSALKTMTIIDDNPMLPSDVVKKYYPSFSLCGLILATKDSNGNVTEEHYYFRRNAVDTITIVDNDGKLVKKFRSTDRYEGYDWYEDYRKERYGEEG